LNPPKKLSKAQTQALQTLKDVCPDAVYAAWCPVAKRQISKATLGALVKAGYLKVKKTETVKYKVRGQFGRSIAWTRERIEVTYEWVQRDLEAL
jgi:hypothetical protein